MCSGVWLRSLAAVRRIRRFSLIPFCPMYSSQREGRSVWSKNESCGASPDSFSVFSLMGFWVIQLNCKCKREEIEGVGPPKLLFRKNLGGVYSQSFVC